MRKLEKNELKLVGSAGSIESLRSLIEERMRRTVAGVEPSAQFAYERKKCYDITTKKGLCDDMVIIKDGKHYKLYFIIKPKEIIIDRMEIAQRVDEETTRQHVYILAAKGETVILKSLQEKLYNKIQHDYPLMLLALGGAVAEYEGKEYTNLYYCGRIGA